MTVTYQGGTVNTSHHSITLITRRCYVFVKVQILSVNTVPFPEFVFEGVSFVHLASGWFIGIITFGKFS